MKILRFRNGRFRRPPGSGVTQFTGSVGLALLVGWLAACTPSAQRGTSKLRLYVGQIKEVTVSSPADTSAQLLAASENKEVVDVSRREAVQEHTTPTNARPTRLVFLLKGVTAGTARVIFSEKPAGQPAQDRVRRTYLVEVVNN